MVDLLEETEKAFAEREAAKGNLITSEEKPALHDAYKLKFMLDEKQMPQAIDHACGFVNIAGKQYRYYGIYLKESVAKKNRKGEIYYSWQLNPVLVLENGRLVSPKTDAGVYIEFLSEMTLRRNRWGLNSMNSFIQNKTPKVSFYNAYCSFKQHYDRSMHFELEGYYSFNAVWDMLTYFQDMLDKSLIIKHEGQSGTAKSKGMKISVNLAFNGRKFVQPSPATFFRYRHFNKAVLAIEEAERLFSDNPKGEDSQLIEYLNASYERGNLVPRCSDTNRNLIEEFDPFGCLRIGSIKPLKGALEDRSVPQSMVKAPKDDPRANVEIGAENAAEFVASRDLMYICALQNYKLFHEALKCVNNKKGFANRQWLCIKPLLAMAHCIDADNLGVKIEAQLADLFEQLFGMREEFYNSESWEFKFAKGLIQYLQNAKMEDKEAEFYDYETLLSVFKGEFSEFETPKISAKALGNMINKIGFACFKCRNSKGTARGYQFSYIQACNILHRNEVLNASDCQKCQKCPKTSDKTPNNTDTLSDNTTNNIINNKSEAIISDASDRLTQYSEGMQSTKQQSSDSPNIPLVVKEEVIK